jgi:RNA polymerase sigma-70 factor (ECF subfamily)
MEEEMEPVDVYEILVEQNEQMLHAYVLGFVSDFQLAEDIVQEAFVQGWSKLSTLKNKKAFSAWIRTIARNIAFERMREREREISVDPDILQGMEDVFGKLDSDDSSNSWQERVAALEWCFERLPEPLRSVCDLHYFKGSKARVIAGKLRLELATVLKRLQRAREDLGKCIEQRLGLDPLEVRNE